MDPRSFLPEGTPEDMLVTSEELEAAINRGQASIAKQATISALNPPENPVETMLQSLGAAHQAGNEIPPANQTGYNSFDYPGLPESDDSEPEKAEKQSAKAMIPNITNNQEEETSKQPQDVEPEKQVPQPLITTSDDQSVVTVTYEQAAAQLLGQEFFNQNAAPNEIPVQEPIVQRSAVLSDITEEQTTKDLIEELNFTFSRFDERITHALDYINDSINEMQEEMKKTKEEATTDILEEKISAVVDHHMINYCGQKSLLSRAVIKCIHEIQDVKTMIGSLQLNISTNQSQTTRVEPESATSNPTAGQSYMPPQASTSQIDTDTHVQQKAPEEIPQKESLIEQYGKRFSAQKIEGRFGMSPVLPAEQAFAYWILSDKKDLKEIFPKAHIADVMMGRQAKKRGREAAMRIFGFLK